MRWQTVATELSWADKERREEQRVLDWLKAADVKFKVESSQMHPAVPRKQLLLAGETVQFHFEWLNNVALPGDPTMLYVTGDTTPSGWFRFHYIIC